MKTEYEKLKEICDKIGYDWSIKYEYCNEEMQFLCKNSESISGYSILNVREIIFTQEFVDKYYRHCFKIGYTFDKLNQLHTDMLQNLDDIVEYLYNFVKGTSKKK